MTTTFETVHQLLEAVQETVTDGDASFKLRTARQLLLVIEQRHDIGKRALMDADIEEETLDNLRSLGYLESSTHD